MFEKYLREQFRKVVANTGSSWNEDSDQEFHNWKWTLNVSSLIDYGNKAMEELVEKTELTQIALLEESKNN